jgi:hypothetical protein
MRGPCLGSTTGLSFAELTQMVLRRLTPDKADFVFNSQQGNGWTEMDSLKFWKNESLNGSAGKLRSKRLVPVVSPLGSLVWPADETYVRRLVDFYFAHSHTLYPILKLR